jgi:hypothetical protein
MTKQVTQSIGLSLVIYGHELVFADIERNLGIGATETVVAGTVLSQARNLVAPQDLWCYSVTVSADTDESDTLVSLASRLVPHADYLNQMKRGGCDVRLQLSLTSEYGQLGLSFSAEAMAVSGALGLPMDIGIFSYGLVDTE